MPCLPLRSLDAIRNKKAMKRARSPAPETTVEAEEQPRKTRKAAQKGKTASKKQSKQGGGKSKGKGSGKKDKGSSKAKSASPVRLALSCDKP
jgi:hypothetical protein